MVVTLLDYQDENDPINGLVIADDEQLSRVLDNLRTRKPFFAELSGEHGYKLLIGIGGPVGCAQYSRADGSPPYLMAMVSNSVVPKDYTGFLAGGTLSPVPARYILPFENVKEIAIYFRQTGARSATVSWEELDIRFAIRA
jgi:hypothetical protein